MAIEILGPGELNVSEGSEEYSLRANRLITHTWLISLDPVNDWLHKVSCDLVDKYSQDAAWNSEHIDTRFRNFQDHRRPQADVSILWSNILREALRLRHGGAFVVVPDIGTAPLRLRYGVRPLDLGAELGATWLSFSAVCNAYRTERAADLLEDHRCQLHRLLSVRRSVGSLSATDGCVVFDHNMVLHGFGATIASNVPPGLAVKPLKLLSGEIVPAEENLRGFGERHRSAYALCNQVAGSLVFVISQDGDLRVFVGAEDYVLFADRLYP